MCSGSSVGGVGGPGLTTTAGGNSGPIDCHGNMGTLYLGGGKSFGQNTIQSEWCILQRLLLLFSHVSGLHHVTVTFMTWVIHGAVVYEICMLVLLFICMNVVSTFTHTALHES